MHGITSDKCVLRKIFPNNNASSAACSVWCGNAHGFGFLCDIILYIKILLL